MYLRARYYDPALGRFLSQDPIESGALYAYAGNNPVTWVDPNGLEPDEPTPVPFPAAGTNDIQPCIDGYAECILHIAPRYEEFTTEKDYVCEKYLRICIRDLQAGLADGFGFFRAEKEMQGVYLSVGAEQGRGFADKFRSGLDAIMSRVNGLPNTGSGGLLPQSKEGTTQKWRCQ